MTGRLGPAAAVSSGGDDGVLELLAPGRDGPVSLAAAAAASLAAAAVVAPRRRAGEVGVGLIPGLDGALGAAVAETKLEPDSGLRAGNFEEGANLPSAVVIPRGLRVSAAALAHHLVGAVVPADPGISGDGGVLLARILPPAPKARLGPLPRRAAVGRPQEKGRPENESE